ncbi:MAG: glutaredoxin family protein [Oceanococcaceae bacterium]
MSTGVSSERARFFTRSDCPLCEEAWAGLADVGLLDGVRRVSILGDDELSRRYGWRIPVLHMADGREFDLAVNGEWERALDALCSPPETGGNDIIGD